VEKRPGLPLVVRELASDDIDNRRDAHFRRRAEPLAAAARQLGLSSEQATRIFAELMNGDGVGKSGGGREMKEFDSRESE